jgi:hypothetical protein
LLFADIPAFRYAGGEYAQYVDASDVSATAEQMVSIALSAAGMRRREVMRSMAHFRAAILDLTRQ